MKRILFVSGFGAGMKARDLAYEFEKYGPLVRCDIPIPRANGTPYAFIEFHSTRDAESAYGSMHERKIDGHRIGVHWAKNPPNASYRERWRETPRAPPSPNSRRRSRSPRHDRPSERRRSRERSRDRYRESDRGRDYRDDRDRGRDRRVSDRERERERERDRDRDLDPEASREPVPRVEGDRSRSGSPGRRDISPRMVETRGRTPPPRGREERAGKNGYSHQDRGRGRTPPPRE